MEIIKYYFKLFFFFSVTCTSFAQLNWEQTKGPYGGQTYDIKADKRGYLYAATQAGLYSSQDLGENWNKIINYSIREIFVHPSGKIFASGYVSDTEVKTWKTSNPTSIQMDSKSILYGKSSKFVLISKDTAKSWKLFTSFTRNINSFFLFNDRTFFASADSGVYASSDSGKTWKYNNFSTITSYGRLMISKFIKDGKNNIYLMGFWDLFKSTDGGNTWNKLIMPPWSAFNFYTIYINNIDEIFVGATGGIYYSSNFGESWKNIYSTYEMFYGFCEDSNKNFFCATLGQGVYQYDRLNNKMILKNKGIMANEIMFLDKINGTFICSAWDIGHFKSSDNGNSWTKLNNPGYNKILVLDNEGRIFASSYGKIFYSSDLDDNWQSIILPNSNNYVMEMAVKENTIVAILDYKKINNENVNDIIKSEDFGKTWKKVFTINGYPSWNNMSWKNMNLLSQNTIYLGFDKFLYLSTDFGNSWKLINNFGGPIQSISVSPWGNVYVGSWSGLYEKIINGWNYIKVSWDSPIVNRISFSSKGEMFILGFDLYVSKDRGKSFQRLTMPMDIPNTVFTNFFIDEKNGKIYLGTQERGLFVANYSYTSVSLPTYSILYNNYPNPFNNQTTIEFFLKESGDIKLEIYNTLGERVYELVNNYTSPGFYKLNWQPKNLSSGIYFYRLHTPTFSETKKMILLK